MYSKQTPSTVFSRRELTLGALASAALSAAGCGSGGAEAATRRSVAVLIKTSPDSESQKHGTRVTTEFVESLRKQDWEEVINLRAPAGAVSVRQTLELATNAHVRFAILGSVAPGPMGTQLRIELYAPPSSRLLWEGEITAKEGNPALLATQVGDEMTL